MVFPAEALANARLSERGNADLLEALTLECPGPWQFDEFHHGLVAPEAATPHPPRVLDLALLHLAVAYALAADPALRGGASAVRDIARGAP